MKVLRLLGVLAGMTAASLGAESTDVRLHFKPRDHALGDVHPFFRDGECFLFYLKPGTYEAALARSRNLLEWKETPLTHDPVKPEQWWSPYFVLGVWRDSSASAGPLYRSFFGHVKGRMASSDSSDLLHWSSASPEYQIPPAEYYERRRDPFVFKISDQDGFGCVMTTWMKGRPKASGGAVSLATSRDLKQWKDHGAILDPGTIGEPECPQMFQLGSRWYLLASIYDRAVGAPLYWMAERPAGPWTSEPAGRLDGKDLCAAQIAFDGEIPLLFGWIPLTPAAPGKQHWGGHLALPREIYATEDGRLATRLARKLESHIKALPWRALKPQSAGTLVTAEWSNFAFEGTVTPSGGTLRLRFLPLGEIVLEPSRMAILDGRGQCWSELPVTIPNGEPVQLRVFVEGNIIEVFANGRFSLAARVPALEKATPLTLELGAVLHSGQVSVWP